jgi:hypothetical protein
MAGCWCMRWSSYDEQDGEEHAEGTKSKGA